MPISQRRDAVADARSATASGAAWTPTTEAAAEMAGSSEQRLVLTSPGSASRPPKPVPLRRILAQLLALVVVLVAVIAVAAIIVSQRIAKQQAVHDVAQITDILAETVIQPALTDAMLDNPAAASAGLRTPVRNGVLSTEVVRVKLWTPQGLVLYSDDQRLIGKTFPLDDEARAALTSARTEASISDLSRPENSFDTAAGKLLEVYRPVWTPAGKPLVFEAYFRYSVVTDRSQDLWRGFSGVMLSSLIAMLLLLAPLLWSFYRRARSVAYQHEALMRRAVEASTQERRRIAATLHDGVVQQLAGTSFTIAGQAQRAENQGDQQLAENLAAAAATVRDSVAGMRSLLVDIYPPSLGAGGAGGFAAALSDLTKSVSTPSVQVRLNLNAEAAAVLNSDQQQAIFRVAQECLRNAAKHAKASTIVLSLTRDGALVTLEVADDGTGFDLGSADQAAVPGHFGLQLMADAAETVDAALSLWSSRDRGTLVRMEIVTS